MHTPDFSHSQVSEEFFSVSFLCDDTKKQILTSCFSEVPQSTWTKDDVQVQEWTFPLSCYLDLCGFLGQISFVRVLPLPDIVLKLFVDKVCFSFQLPAHKQDHQITGHFT